LTNYNLWQKNATGKLFALLDRGRISSRKKRIGRGPRRGELKLGHALDIRPAPSETSRIFLKELGQAESLRNPYRLPVSITSRRKSTATIIGQT
jgi:hypothetical protein